MIEPPSGVFGRRAEQDLLLSTLADQPEVRARIVEVSGEPGIGKTALMDWFVSQARSAGWTCLTAQCFAVEQGHPYGALAQLLDSRVAAPGVVERLDPFEVADLSAALPGLRSVAGAAGPVTAEPLLVARAGHHALAELGGDGPGTILALDDAQWCDEASGGALGHIARHWQRGGLIVAVTSRAPWGGLRALGLELARTLTVDQLILEPLDEPSVEALLSGLPEGDRREIGRVARGNPFFLIELRSSYGQGRDGAGPHDMPATLRAAVAADVTSVSAQARALLHAAAVLGDPFDLAVSARLAELPDAAEFPAIDELVASGLVMTTSRPGRFRFRHPLVGSITYQGLAPGWRLATHAQAAQLLMQAGYPRSVVATHVQRSAAMGDRWAIDYLQSAADDVRELAPATAASMAASALSLLPDDQELSQRRLDLMDLRADCLIKSGQLEQARVQIDEALDLIPETNPARRAMMAINAARVAGWLGHDDKAWEGIENCWRNLPEGPAVERVMLDSVMLVFAAERGDTPAMREHSQAAEEALAVLDIPYLRFSLACARAYGEAVAGSCQKAARFAGLAETLRGELTEAEARGILEQLVLLASAELWLGLFPSSLAHASQALLSARAEGNRAARLWLALVAEGATVATGDLRTGLDYLDEAEQAAHAARLTNAIPLVLSRRSSLAMVSGDEQRAKEARVECLAYLEAVTERGARAAAAVNLAPVLVSAGQPEVARDVVMRYCGPDLQRVALPLRTYTLESMVRAELAAGDLGAARRWQATVRPDYLETASARCHWHRIEARIRLAQEEPRSAVAAARQAVDQAREAASILEILRSEALLAEALTAADEAAEAVALLQQVWSGALECGAGQLVAQAAAGLRRLRAPVPAKPQDNGGHGLSALSPREREVAGLVADGLNNSEIAHALYISPRTVESHLRRIFDKLDARNRSEVRSHVLRQRVSQS